MIGWRLSLLGGASLDINLSRSVCLSIFFWDHFQDKQQWRMLGRFDENLSVTICHIFFHNSL